MSETMHAPYAASQPPLPHEEALLQPPTAAEFLMSLPHEGFDSDAQRELVISQIDAVGLPVDNFRSLARKPNDEKLGTENHLGSWGIYGPEAGQFSVYERLEQDQPEERLATIAHEGAHAASALNPENAHLFGGEAERQEAERMIRQMAEQSIVSNKYLTGYHKYLANQLYAGEISFDLFAEETQAIATELAMTNRAKLAQVEASQHVKIDRMKRGGLVPEDYQTINLISGTDEKGQPAVDGIDKQLIALVRGVSSYQDLLQHVGSLKAKFYPDETLAVANQRWQAQIETQAYAAWIAENERRIREQSFLSFPKVEVDDSEESDD